MSYAPNYTPTVGFATEETNSVAGRSTVRTVAVDNELANISSSINGLNTNIKLLQRSDGRLIDGLIEPYQLSEQTNALIAASTCEPRGVWAQNTDYAYKDIVQYSNIAQICLTAHNAGTVFTQAYWLPISGDGTSAANAAAAAASALAASSSETAASVSATAASNSAIAADASADAAAISETNAANSAVAAASVISGSVVSASQAEAEAGVENTKFMSALRVKQALDVKGVIANGQIQFPAAQNASANANTLDDYEEGTVTDTGIALTFSTPGNLSVTYSTREVYYTKVGNRCLVHGRIITSAFTHTTASGSLTLTGALPFAVARTISVPITLDGGTWSSLLGPFYATITAGSSTILIEHNNTNGQRMQILTTNCPTGTNKYIYFNFQYEV
jgi:hypothetical protein